VPCVFFFRCGAAALRRVRRWGAMRLPGTAETYHGGLFGCRLFSFALTYSSRRGCCVPCSFRFASLAPCFLFFRCGAVLRETLGATRLRPKPTMGWVPIIFEFFASVPPAKIRVRLARNHYFWPQHFFRHAACVATTLERVDQVDLGDWTAVSPSYIHTNTQQQKQ
jgi:hypothetical protein